MSDKPELHEAYRDILHRWEPYEKRWLPVKTVVYVQDVCLGEVWSLSQAKILQNEYWERQQPQAVKKPRKRDKRTLDKQKNVDR